LRSVGHVAPRKSTCRSRNVIKATAASSEPAKKQAYMHDFCLTIPYGFLVAVGGLMGFVMAGSTKSLMMGGGSGALIMGLGFLSLNRWKARLSCAPVTGLSLVLASGLTFMMGKRFMATGAFFPSGLVAGLSAVMVLFYIYNFIAGGNPPPKKTN